MKITKRQLAKIIAEEKRKLVEAAGDEWYSDQDETFADYLYRTNTERDEEEAAYFDEMEELEAMREPEAGQDWPKRSGMGRRGADGTPRIAGKRSGAERDHMYGRRKFKEGHSRLVRESVADMVGFENLIDDFAIDVADKFQESMLELSKEPGMVEDYQSWNEEAFRAAGELEALVASEVKKAIERIESQLHNGDYAR